MRKNKIFIAKINRLIGALEEEEDIFFEERPFLEDRSLEPEIKTSDRRYENTKKIKKIKDEINEVFRQELQEKIRTAKQTGISGVAE